MSVLEFKNLYWISSSILFFVVAIFDRFRVFPKNDRLVIRKRPFFRRITKERTKRDL